MQRNEIRELLHELDLGRKKILRPRFLELGLTVGEGQPRILKCLLQEGKLTQRELADRCRVDVTTMSRTLDRMERAGLLVREANPRCRRSYLIVITEEGRKKAQKVQGIFEELDSQIWEGIEETEMENLCKTLKKIQSNLEK